MYIRAVFHGGELLLFLCMGSLKDTDYRQTARGYLPTRVSSPSTVVVTSQVSTFHHWFTTNCHQLASTSPAMTDRPLSPKGYWTLHFMLRCTTSEKPSFHFL